ncbi:unnamed protein product, partial [Timema podura]|nr:unnamed protein product [Timema podura]
MPTNNLVRTCTSFDFQPGNRIAAFNGATEYEESTCYLTQEQGDLDGISNLFFVPNSVHFIEVCLSSSRIENECPNRRYVFERHPRKALKVPDQDMKLTDMKEVSALNRSDCEDRCLNEFTFVCRSISYNAGARTCLLSRFTRRSHPERFVDDPTSDYLENTCLSAERRCDGIAVFVKEENKRLGGPFEMDIYSNFTLEECQIKCLQAEKYFCRSIEYDVQSRQCSILEEDTVSQKDDLRTSSSPTHHIYELVCLEDQQGGKIPDNSVTSHLFSDGRRPDTAFQRYRNNRLGGEYHSEITGRTLSECLDECLRQASFQCRSAVYSERFRICRLSRFNQRDGLRIIYDADYDYYENLMNRAADDEKIRPITWMPMVHLTDLTRWVSTLAIMVKVDLHIAQEEVAEDTVAVVEAVMAVEVEAMGVVAEDTVAATEGAVVEVATQEEVPTEAMAVEGEVMEATEGAMEEVTVEGMEEE